MEANGRAGILITIKTGSGQRDPLSSNLFLIAMEPLKRLLIASFLELICQAEKGFSVAPSPLALKTADQLCLVLSLCDEYTEISGLNININKTMVQCNNIPAPLRM